jgi:uracil-DNA glycosylase family 4
MDADEPDEQAERASPRGELARLAHGLERHVKRRVAAGVRRTRAVASEPRTAASGTRAKANDAQASRARADAKASDARTDESAKRARSDAHAVEARGGADPVDASLGASLETPLGTALDRPARDANDVRAQAAAARDLGELAHAVSRCEACGLCKTRTQTVFMDGRGTRPVMFVGEAPGAEEDRRGVPFVGRAGQLLTDIITKGMGLARDEVLIANVLKCRPPENRDPTTEEKAICTPWLDRQIELLDPRVIIPLGRHAAMHVLGMNASMGAMRGRIHERAGRQIVPTFHPAYLLRNPADKKECWKDIRIAMGLLGISPPASPSPRSSDSG